MAPASAKIALSVLNLTDRPINASLGDIGTSSVCALNVQTSAVVGHFTALPISKLTLTAYDKATDAEHSVTLGLRRRISTKRKWEPLDCQEAPWRIYRLKLSKNHHRIVIFTERPLASWMSDLPDSLPLSSLCLPGTHETMALYGWPFSQCQDIDLAGQFLRGVRMIDIRIVLVSGVLQAYHGATPERSTFTSILSSVCAYIRSPEGQRETIIMSIMEEDSFIPSSPLFSKLVHDAILSAPSSRDLWYLEPRVPKLGEVRGKIVLFSRFGKNGEDWENGLNGLGIHPPRWPNNVREGFDWEIEGTRARTQDWYGIPSFLSIPEKFEAAVKMLDPVPAPSGKNDLAITYLSAARIPLALPSTVACGFGWAKLGVEGVNSRVGRWLLQRLVGEDDTAVDTQGSKPENGSEATLVGVEKGLLGGKHGLIDVQDAPEPRLRGWVLIDFIRDPYDMGIIPLLVECNWRGRVEGEEVFDSLKPNKWLGKDKAKVEPKFQNTQEIIAFIHKTVAENPDAFTSTSFEWDCCLTEEHLEDTWIEERKNWSDAAYRGDWDSLFKIAAKEPGNMGRLANVTHLLPTGVIARERGFISLAAILEPPPDLLPNISPAALENIQEHFATVVKTEAKRAFEPGSMRIADLGLLREVESIWMPVPGMYGGFNLCFEGDHLTSESWCRVVGGSGMRYHITADGAVEGFV